MNLISINFKHIINQKQYHINYIHNNNNIKLCRVIQHNLAANI